VQKINPQLAIENINYALSNWNNAHNRLIVVQELAKKEAQYHMETYLFRSILAFFEGKSTMFAGLRIGIRAILFISFHYIIVVPLPI
jgi:hypothetical protein